MSLAFCRSLQMISSGISEMCIYCKFVIIRGTPIFFDFVDSIKL